MVCLKQLNILLIYQTALNNAKFRKEISDRQFNLIHNVMRVMSESNKFLSKAELYRIPQIQILYDRKTERTFYRDIDKLVELKFLSEQDGLVVMGN